MTSPPATPQPWLFGSFFIGGFECSTPLTIDGSRLDITAASQHDTLARQDYALCKQVGLCAVREAARWPLIDQGGTLWLEEVRELARLGRALGLIQLWDLMHYGYPDDLDPFAADFIPRFAAYAKAVATVIREQSVGPTYYTPINEISYYAFAGGEIGYMAPFLHGRGGDLKRALVRAAVAGINAIWEADPEAIILSVDPLVRLHPPAGRPDLQADADFFNQHVVTEGFDMLAGRVAPELGGSRRHLGIIGLNFYASNQWTIATPEQPQRFLERVEPDWLPLSDMLGELQTRYGGPLVIAETGASGDDRAEWLRYLTAEARRARALGVDLQGICLYPVISTPDWEDPTAFFDGGVFDVLPQPDGSLQRILSLPTAAALREAQQQLDPANTLTLPDPDSSFMLEGALDPSPTGGGWEGASSAPPTHPQPLPMGGEISSSPTGGGWERASGASSTHPQPLPMGGETAAELIVAPLDHARFRADNFAYQTLLAGEQMSIDLYCFEPGGVLPTHRYPSTEQVWTVLTGEAEVQVGDHCAMLRQGETLLIPAGVYHGLRNGGTARLVIQRVSSPKPWDARFAGPHPASDAKNP